jgi:predicted DNA-binding protein
MTESTTTTLRFKKDQYEKIKELAEFNGMTVTMFMRDTMLNRIEEDEDYRDGVRALHDDSGVTTGEDFTKELGLS